jgi:hypothetical protein
MIHRNKNFIICYVKFFMKIFFTAVFIFLSISFVSAQNLTGIWRGHFWQGTLHSNSAVQQLIGDDRYKFEVQIAQTNKIIEAVTYSYLTTIFYGKATADGTVNNKTKKVVLRELKLVEVRSLGGGACAMTCFMQYSKIGDEEFLEGTWTSTNLSDSAYCGKGTVFLRKVPMSDFHKEPFVEKRENEIAENKKTEKSAAPEIKKNNPVASSAKPNNSLKKPAVVTKKPGIKKDSASSATSSSIKKNTKPPAVRRPVQHNPSQNDIARETIKPMKIDSIKPDKKITAPVIIPKVLTSRQNQLVKTITVNTNEIELDIYDDGTIDNDTVSVFLDKKMVIAHAMLTDRPIVMKVHLDEDDDYHEVVMVADNEGTIPPNTSLMIVKAGDKRYEVRIVSTEQKNATVIFKYEKPK